MLNAQTKHYRQYLVLLGVGFVCAMAILAGVNAMVDPAHILASQNQEKRMAELVIGGKNLAGVSDFNERLFQSFRIRLMDNPPDRIVIGSSRALQIRDGMLPGRTVNNAVSGASLEDYFAIVQMYRASGMLPKQIVLVTDGWIFNISHQQDRWVSVRNECNVLAVHLGVSTLCPSGAGGLTSQTLRELVSLGYLHESLKRLLRDGQDAVSLFSKTRNANFKATDHFPLETGGRFADGSALYPAKFRGIRLVH